MKVLLFLFLFLSTYVLSHTGDPMKVNDEYMEINNISYNKSEVIKRAVIEEDLPPPMDFIHQMLQDVMIEVANNTEELSDQCRGSVRFIAKDENIRFIKKFMSDSANNKNDVEQYEECISAQSKESDTTVDIMNPEDLNNYSDQEDTNPPGYDQEAFAKNLTYVILQISKGHWVSRADMRYVSGKYLLGVCFIKGCSEEEYTKVFFQMNLEMSNALQLKCKEELTLFDMQNYTIGYHSYMFVCLIPFYLVLLQFIFSLFPSIPAFIFSCCFRKVKKTVKTRRSSNILDRLREDDELVDDLLEEEKEINSQEFSFTYNGDESNILKQMRLKYREKTSSVKTVNTDGIKLHEFRASFSITVNTEEFFTSNHSNYNKDSGLSKIRGIRGFSIIFMIIGNIYLYLITSPLKIYSEFQHKALLTSTFYGIIQFGLRFAPRILIACSGISLTYKLLSYLDEIVESTPEEIKNKSCEDEKKKTAVSPSILEGDLFIDEKRKDYPEVKMGHLLRFYSYQGYKYLLFILLVSYFKFSFYQFSNLLYNPEPVWVYLKKEIIDKLTTWKYMGTLFLFYSYTQEQRDFINPFWVAVNEITFFILTTFIIFFSYKKNFRMDIFFLLIFILLVSFKLLYFFYTDKKLIPGLGNHIDGEAHFYTSPIFNYTFYIIGIFIGLTNYVVQTSVTRSSIKSSGKTYLNWPLCFVRFYKTNKGVKVTVTTVFGVSLAALIAMSYPILYSVVTGRTPDKFMERFNTTTVINIFYLVDTEIFICLLLVILISLFILGDNFFVDFFSHDYWSFISRSYYSFILVCDQVILFIFYQSETRIKLEIFNILFFALFTVSFTLVVSIFVHVILEMPYKKLNKIIWQPFKGEENISPATQKIANFASNEDTVFSRSMDD